MSCLIRRSARLDEHDKALAVRCLGRFGVFGGVVMGLEDSLIHAYYLPRSDAPS